MLLIKFTINQGNIPLNKILLVGLLSLSCAPQDKTESDLKILGLPTLARGDNSATVSAVSILRDNNLVCGGVLINSNTVLTAAHCAKYDNERVQLSFGLWEREGPKRSGQFLIHPKFSYDKSVTVDGTVTYIPINDIAIIKLNRPIQQSNELGKEIRFAKLPTVREIKKDLFGSGYGKGKAFRNSAPISDYDSDEFGGRLKYNYLEYDGNARLGAWIGGLSGNSSKESHQAITKVFRTKATKGYLCAGDSGSGVFQENGYLVGINSAISDKIENGRVEWDCEKGLSYAVRVYDYLRWINTGTVDNTPANYMREDKRRGDRRGKVDSHYINKEFNVKNKSSLTITEIYAAPDFASDLGFNILQNDVLKVGEELKIRINDRSCNYVFKAVFNDKSEKNLAGNICKFNNVDFKK